MTSTGLQSMGGFPLDRHAERPRDRLRLYLRSRYAGPGATKRLSRDIASSPKTAENILNGCWPSDLHFAAIVRRFGRDLLDALFLPEIDPVIARLTSEEASLARQLQAVRARRLEAEGGAAGVQGVVEAAAAAGDELND